MNEKERRIQIDGILVKLTLYYDKELPDSILNMYNSMLSNVDLNDLSQACTQWVATKKWFPKISELLDIVNANRTVKAVSLESRAQQQWRLVLTAVRQRGIAKGAPKFDDPVTNVVVRNHFSWNYLCNMEVDNLNWEMDRFTKAYELAAEQSADNLQIENAPAKVLRLIKDIG